MPLSSLRSRSAMGALWAAGPIVLASLAAPSSAQNVPAVGPDRAPPELPTYATPPQSPLAPQQLPAPAPTVTDGGAEISNVVVQANNAGEDAVPPPGWAMLDGTELAYSPGEPLSQSWVQRQFQGRLLAGPISPSTAVGLVQQINRAFASAGFVNSGVLIVGSDQSTLKLSLIYGQLGGADGKPGLAVDWADGHNGGLSTNYVRHRFGAAAGQPLNALDIERDFRLLAEDPAIRSINAALRPGEEAGLASLQLTVRPAQRFDINFKAANDRSPSVGSEQLLGGASLRNALSSGDLVSVETGFTDGTQSGQLSYATPFLVRGTTLVLRGGFNRAAVVDRPLVPLDIRTRDRNFEAGLTQTIVRTPLMPHGEAGRWHASQTLNVGLFGVDRRQKSFLLGEPFSFAPGSVDGRTEYQAARLTADYLRRNVRSVIAASLTGTMGLGGTQSDIPSVPNPKDRFSSVLGNVAFARRLAENGLELRGRLTGQWSGGTLYSSERLSIGGVNSVRGYRESLFLADRGVMASAELAYPIALGRRQGNAITLSVFSDGAWFKNAGVDRLPAKSIASIGAAAAWSPFPGVRLMAAYGHALKKVQLPQTRDLQDHGVHLRIVVHPLELF